MTAFQNFLTKAKSESLLAPAARTATANGTGVDLSKYEGGALAILDSAAGTGTTPTLDVKLQESDTLGGTYTDIPGGAFVQVIAASQQRLLFDVNRAKAFVRAVSTIAGTSPSFTYNLSVVALPKYV